MLKQALLTAVFLSASHTAYAQQPPSAGSQLQQIPRAQEPEKVEPGLRIERPDAPGAAQPGGPTTPVRSLRLTGQTVFTEAELIAATGFSGQVSLSLADLRAMAGRISAFYHQRGYFLAQAYLPAQDISDGAVTISVMEGRYGAIDLKNQSGLKDDVALRILHGLDAGDLAVNAPLERRLLLLSDIPGVVVSSTLSPGEAVGTSDLSVGLTPGPRVSGSLEADNAGSRYTGEYRAGGTVNFNNLTGRGDVASLRVLASDAGLAYGRAAYQTQLGSGAVGVSYAYLGYELGREFDSLDAKGKAQVLSLYGAYPLARSRAGSLYAQANLDLKSFDDEVGLTATKDRRKAQMMTLGLSGERRDGYGGGGWNSFSIGASLGNLDIQSPLNLAQDAATAQTNGGYGKLQFSAARLQSVTAPLSVYGAVRGQLASQNLDTSEKMELGGAYGVRAFPEGEAYGDEGYVATVEARLRLSGLPANSPVQATLVAFVDTGAVHSSKDPWSAGANTQRRSAVGVGANLDLPRQWLVRVSYAWGLGDQQPTATPESAHRGWVQVAKLF